jgi:hypothetical protein
MWSTNVAYHQRGATVRPIIPTRASEITITDSNYVVGTLRQFWEELPLLLICALIVSIAGMPMVWIALHGAVLPALLAGVVLLAPLWGALCYVAGRNTLGCKPHLGDFLSAWLHFYARSCLLALVPALVITLVLVSLPLLVAGAPILGYSGVIVQAIILCALGLLMVHAFPLLALFDLPLRQVWLYSLALVLRWPGVTIGLVSLAFLLGLAARYVGLAALPLVPLVFVPFNASATLMLAKRVKDAASDGH